MDEFHRAYTFAAASEEQNIEVSEQLFKILTRGKDTPYLTYGNPAVFVYKAGTRAQCESNDSVTTREKLGL